FGHSCSNCARSESSTGCADLGIRSRAQPDLDVVEHLEAIVMAVMLLRCEHRRVCLCPGEPGRLRIDLRIGVKPGDSQRFPYRVREQVFDRPTASDAEQSQLPFADLASHKPEHRQRILTAKPFLLRHGRIPPYAIVADADDSVQRSNGKGL